MVRAVVMMIDEVWLNIFVVVHCPEYRRLIITPNISSIDAVAWVRKYLVEASMDRGLKFFIRMGMVASIFISKPIQMNSQ
jgi:hypothetical protein